VRGLRDKGVLITGGSRGIGKATVERFLEEGSRVVTCSRDAAELESTVQDLSPLGWVQGVPCDVSVPEEVERLVAAAEDSLGAIDVLINNAGIAWEQDFLTMTPEEWDRLLNVNLRGAFLVAQAVARRMVVCPGYIQTPMSAAIDDPEFIAAYERDKIPLRRVGRPEEVAAAYAFLASDEASFIHGEALVIDGGQLCQ
jgi:NAD(P)-dependent dehydrogenase (short-subunit alcohol dehydrogenase family)